MYIKVIFISLNKLFYFLFEISNFINSLIDIEINLPR